MGVPPTIEVANLGMADTLILMVLALVVFGPRRLPQIGRQVGKLMYEFRKASNDFKFQMEEELRNSEEADRRKKEEEERQRQLAANPPAQIEASITPPAEAPAVDSYRSTYGEPTETPAPAESAYSESQPQNQLTIQPPSTGEPVPAAWSAAETASTATEDAAAEVIAPESPAASAPIAASAAEETSVEKEDAVPPTTVESERPATEPAHNG